jgi:hypothetical protein
VGSGLWELLFRPGFFGVSSWLTRTWTTFDNTVFSEAALDPRPIPGLLLILLVAQVPLWIATGVFVTDFLSPRLRRILEGLDVQTAQGTIHRLERTNHRLAWTAIAIFCLLYAFALLGYSIANNAVLVWRYFHKNLAICAPLLSTTEEEKILEAQFRAMHQRSDFVRIRIQLDAIAHKSGIVLDWPRDLR